MHYTFKIYSTSQKVIMQARTILDFWFKETSPELWFRKDEQFDQTIAQRFSTIWEAATRGELSEWRKTIQGRLAEIIILDQFSRNLHRRSPLAFTYDGMALVLAQEAAQTKEFYQLSRLEAGFLLMPYMHSESAFIHQQAEILFKNYGTDNNYHYELKHKVIIDRFGRYPHRNEVLARQSTPEEIEFLKQEGSSF